MPNGSSHEKFIGGQAHFSMISVGRAGWQGWGVSGRLETKSLVQSKNITMNRREEKWVEGSV